MPQIGFTHKTEPIYDRFNQLRRAYEDANGGSRVYNPDFLSVLMDKWEEGEMIASAINACMQALPNVSIRAYIADAEANDPELQPVRIKDSNNRYISDVGIATSNIDLTSCKADALVFGSCDEAKAFLRKWGRVVEGWILEPVN